MAEPSDPIEPIPLSSIDESPEPSGEIPLGPPIETVEPKRPKPQSATMTPLPRIWKAEPEDAPKTQDADSRPSKKESAKTDSTTGEKSRRTVKRSKAGKEPKDGEPKGVLLEETPKLDTHETRQRIRIALGSGVTLVLFLVGYLIYRTVASGPTPDETPIDPALAVVAPATNPKESDEEVCVAC